MNDEKRLLILEEYLNSSQTKASFQKERGLGKCTISRWLSIFALEDKPTARQVSMKEPTMPSWQPQEQEVGTIDPQDEIARLKKELREKELELKKSNMLRDAYSKMIDLAEEKYSIAIRKNSGAK